MLGDEARASSASRWRRASPSAPPPPSAAPKTFALASCSPAAPAPDRLVDLFNTKAIDATVAAEADVAALASAVRSACRDHGMRLQQQRMAVELERVLRDRRRPLEPAAGLS